MLIIRLLRIVLTVIILGLTLVACNSGPGANVPVAPAEPVTPADKEPVPTPDQSVVKDHLAASGTSIIPLVQFCGSQHTEPTVGTSHLESLVEVGSAPPSSVCICGYQANENIGISLIDPQGEVLASRVTTIDGEVLPQVEEVQEELATYEYFPVLTIAEIIPAERTQLMGEKLNLNSQLIQAALATATPEQRQPSDIMIAKPEMLELNPETLPQTNLNLADNLFNLKQIEIVGDPVLQVVGGTPLYCKNIDELRDFTFLPSDLPGEYRIEVSGEETNVGYTFDLQPLTEPLIVYVEREDRFTGFVLAGFQSSEAATVLEYDSEGDLVAEDDVILDEEGVLLADDVPADHFLFAVRDDFSYVPTTVYDGPFETRPMPGPPLDYDLVVAQNPDNGYAYYQRGLYRLRELLDEEKAAEDFQTALELASQDQRLRDMAEEILSALNP